jgi:hypothetical protein
MYLDIHITIYIYVYMYIYKHIVIYKRTRIYSNESDIIQHNIIRSFCESC